MADPIPFIDLQAQRRRLGEPLNAAIKAAVESGQWILGPQVRELEEKLAAFAGVKHSPAFSRLAQRRIAGVLSAARLFVMTLL